MEKLRDGEAYLPKATQEMGMGDSHPGPLDPKAFLSPLLCSRLQASFLLVPQEPPLLTAARTLCVPTRLSCTPDSHWCPLLIHSRPHCHPSHSWASIQSHHALFHPGPVPSQMPPTFISAPQRRWHQPAGAGPWRNREATGTFSTTHLEGPTGLGI